MSRDNQKDIEPALERQVTPQLRQAVEEKSREGSITCAVLRSLAEELNVPYRVAGAAADSVGIKVKSCELGCF